MLVQLGYLALMVAIFAEAAGIPAPGESSLIAASVLAAAGELNIVVVVALAAVAAIAGDNVGYLLGRRLGRRVLVRGGRWRRHRLALLERSERFFARHGGKAVFIGRWLPVLRITAAWMAGASGMHWRRFAVWNGLGGISWAASIGGVAYGLGASSVRVIAIAAAVVLVAKVAVMLALRRRRAAAPRLDARPLSCEGVHAR